MMKLSAAAIALLVSGTLVLEVGAQSRIGAYPQPGKSMYRANAQSTFRPVSSPAPATGAMNELRGGGYCSAGADGTGLGLDERITNVTFAGINNTSANAAPTAPSYTAYLASVANVTVGSSYPVSIGVSSSLAGGTSFAENQALVWIDLNQDFDFEDAGELVFVSTIGAVTAYTGNITIPGGTPTGTTRMRVRLHDTHDGTDYINNFNDTPCDLASYGEVEDYTVQVGSGGGSAPANDLCSNATPIVPGASCTATAGNMQGATQSLAPSACSGFTSTSANDVWFSFVATTTTTVIGAAGGGDATTGLDVILEVYAGNCAALTSLGCSDTSLRAGTEGMTVTTTPGSTYYYRIYDWNYGTTQTVFDYATCVVAVSGGTGYCTAGADGTGLGLEERIINVNFAGIDNDSPDAAAVAPAYSDFTAVTGSVQQGGSYAINVDVARNGSNTGFEENQVLAWIDWNQDLDFEDAGEQVLVSAIGALDIYTGTVVVPAGATLGTTRMRVRLHDTHDGSAYVNNFNDTPCGLASYGEVEDYSITVTGGGSAPANDLCTNVTPVNLNIGGNVVFVGDNTGATDTEGLPPASVWHAFTTTECANITIDYCGTNPAFENAFLNLFVGCPFTTFVGPASFDATTCANGGVTIRYTNVAPGTYYYAVLTEAGSEGAYAISVSASACAPPDAYCTAGAVAVVEEKISSVVFADISNNSAGNAGYEDFTAITASVVGGQSYPISVSIAGGYATDQVLAWIDWDHNSAFDAGEIVFSSAIGVGPHTGNVTVPLTALPGPTRMRIRLHDTYTGPNYQNTPNATPCDTSTYGQVEDYTVNMVGIITGASELTAGTWSVFPNPSNGDMTVRYAGVDGRATFELLDMTGRIVYSEQRAVVNGANVDLNLADRLAAGTYALRIGTEQGTEEHRIVVR